MSQGKEETKVDASQQSPPSSPTKGETGPTYEAFVKNLSFSVGDNEIKNFFQSCGTVERVNVLKNFSTGRSKGVAFVRFSDEGALQKALALSGAEFEGRSIYVEKTIPKEQRPAGNDRPGGDRRRDNEPNERDPNSTSVFVGNLSYQTTEDSLRQLFSNCGAIREVRIATDPSGGSRGFAHVDFEAPESVEQAVQISGQDVDGRNIRVDYSNKRKEGGGGSRGGFRGGFRGGDRGGYRGGDRGGFRGGDRGGYRGGDRGGFRGGDRGGFRGDRGGSRGGRGGYSRGGYGGGFDGDRETRGGSRGGRRGD